MILECAGSRLFAKLVSGAFLYNGFIMEKKDLRIVFMGTPDFAVASLRSLVEGGYNVVGVVTATDKPVGRHRNTLVAPAVKKYALEAGLPLLQPEKLKDEDFLEALRAWKADLHVVVAFRMLPEVVWAMPRFGTLNVHASLLPQYRGAAPINWAVINGDRESGVTTFFLRHDIDTGDVAMQSRVSIGSDDTAGDLHDKLMEEGARLLTGTVDRLIAGTLKPVPQAGMQCGAPLLPAPKIFTETCRIDFAKGLDGVYDFIRGLAPHPAAWTEVSDGEQNYTMKIYRAAKRYATHNEKRGTFVFDVADTMSIAVDGGYIDVLELQLSGKKRMAVGDFLRGFRNVRSLRVLTAD